MKMLIHIHRMIRADSDIPGVIANLCSAAETTIVLEGAAISSMRRLTGELERLNARFRLCVEDAAERLPLQGNAERIGPDGFSELISQTDRFLSF